MNATMHIRFCLLALLLTLGLNLIGQSPGAGHSLGFSSGSESLSGANLPSYNFDTTLTLEAWIYLFAPSDGVVFGLDHFDLIGTMIGYRLRLVNAGISENLVLETPNGTISTSGAPIQFFTWHHVAMVSSSTGVRLYLDGIPVASGPTPPAFSPSSLDMCIGCSPALGGMDHFLGELDEVRIWNRPLTQTEIRDWMCKKVLPSHPAYAHLTGYWRLDDASGSTANDLSPSANTLTLNASPVWGPSAAPIGDRSIWQYGSAYDLRLASPQGDTLRVHNVSGNPVGLQLYAVDEAPNVLPVTPGFAAFDNTHYYGVFPVGGSSPTMTARYASGGNAFFAPLPACEIGLAGRDDGASPSWSAAPGTLDLPARAITIAACPAPIQLLAGHRDDPWNIIAQPDTSACLGDSIELSTYNGAVAYNWLFGGNPIPGANGSSIWVSQTGAYSLDVNANGCLYHSDPVSLNFVALPVASLSAPGSTCVDGGSLTLNGTPAGGIFSGPGLLGSSFYPSLAGPGNHLITYTFVDSINCRDHDSAYILVHPAPTAQLGPLGDHCQGAGNLVLSGGLPLGGSYFGPGVSGGQLDPFAAGLGLIPIGYLVIDGNGCDDTAFADIQVLPSPTTPTISAAGNTLFSSAPSGNQWFDGNGPIAGATGQSFQPPASGLYYVLVTDSSGCSSDTSFAWNFILGVAAGDGPRLGAWPNPTAGALQVTWPPVAGECQLALYQLDGRCVRQWRVAADGGGFGLDLEELSGGIYLLRVVHPDGDGVLRLWRE